MKSYKGKSIGWLKAKAQSYFNAFIRERDNGKGCISCDSFHTPHATHFYSVRMYDGLRFNEDNVHGGCVSCNTFLHGNLFEYGKRLPDRIGRERFERLQDCAAEYKRHGHKWERRELIEIIEKYKNKLKTLQE